MFTIAGESKGQGRLQSRTNILDVGKKSLMGELSSAIERHCSCYLSSWRYLTWIDIFGGDDGARFTVASECDVLEARFESPTTTL